ncbi:MAG: hypothetical protein GY712_04175, partial [Oceanicoccus sp.]|uniref:hypothetical protein n=1 Tax=Oceanicoccus sp. TaxID=2691044 RepID=UPI002620F588
VREEEVEASGVLTVTGIVASPIQDESKPLVDLTAETVIKSDADTSGANSAAEVKRTKKSITVTLLTDESDNTSDIADAKDEADETAILRQEIVQDIRRRVRFLLTLKGRPPFRLAGLEMYRGLQELIIVLDRMLVHYSDATLMTIRQALSSALIHFSTDFQLLSQVELWLRQIATILDPDMNPSRDGATVELELSTFLDELVTTKDEWLTKIKQHLLKKTANYASGLFHTYNNLVLPRTNNDIESAFRDVQRRLLSTTGQKGLTKRLLHRYG